MDALKRAYDISAPTILVADDSELNRTLFRRMLNRSGYNVIETKDGGETLEEIERGPPDLVLLDLRMPEIDGVEVLRQVRRCYEKSTLPVVIVTAEHDVETAEACLGAGANDYITKPIVWSILRARLEAHLFLHVARDSAFRRVPIEGRTETLELDLHRTFGPDLRRVTQLHEPAAKDDRPSPPL